MSRCVAFTKLITLSLSEPIQSKAHIFLHVGEFFIQLFPCHSLCPILCFSGCELLFFASHVTWLFLCCSYFITNSLTFPFICSFKKLIQFSSDYSVTLWYLILELWKSLILVWFIFIFKLCVLGNTHRLTLACFSVLFLTRFWTVPTCSDLSPPIISEIHETGRTFFIYFPMM